MTDHPENKSPSEVKPNPGDSTLRSPIRPANPNDSMPKTAPLAKPRSGLLAKGAEITNTQQMAAAKPQPPSTGNLPPAPGAPAAQGGQPQDPAAALEILRRKMEIVANEFSQGKINRAQFNAIYGRYTEQLSIVAKIIERNPNNDAWKLAAAPGHTTFLRDHFESRLLYYLVYQHQIAIPLMMGGPQQANMDQVSQVLKTLWGLPNRPKVGLARKSMNNGQWLVLALGEFAVTLALFQLEPSAAQANLVRDLHADFERANKRALERGTRSLDRFVFPQRALAEKQF